MKFMDEDGKNDSIIDHSEMHNSKHGSHFHSDIHDHKKVHESMHLGDDIKNPFNF